jgi:hypothetical protein
MHTEQWTVFSNVQWNQIQNYGNEQMSQRNSGSIGTDKTHQWLHTLFTYWVSVRVWSLH